MTRFVKGATTVQFAAEPLRNQAPRSVAMVQSRGLDSAGNNYAYSKRSARRLQHSLTFKVSDTVLADLRAFVTTTIDGVRHTFTWYDAADTARTVRLASPAIEIDPLGPGRHRVTIDLTEDVA